MSRHVVVRIEALVFDYRLNEEDLRSVFSRFGDIKDVMLLDEQVAPDTGIVEFATPAAATAAAAIDGSEQNVEGYTGILRVVLMTPAVERALLVKAHILASSPEDRIDPFGNFNSLNKFTCRYVVGAERMNSEYSVIGRILGVGGENVKGIYRATGCHVKINGKAKSAEEPLNVRISAENRTAFERGKAMTERLIQDMYDDYAKWCERHYIQVAPIRLRVVTGQETLRPLGRLIDYSFSNKVNLAQ